MEKSPQIKLVLDWQYKTICRGPRSVFARLRRLPMPPGSSIDDYIDLYCLRRVPEYNGRVVSEQVYVHSKLCIVDDRIAIIGSANINDRSMLGSRDSEVAVVVSGDDDSDSSVEKSVMDGKPWRASKFAFDLRCALWAEHVGFLTMIASTLMRLRAAYLTMSREGKGSIWSSVG